MIFPSSFALAHGAEHFTWLEQCGWLLFRKNKCPDVDEIIDAKDVYVCVYRYIYMYIEYSTQTLN